MHTDGKGQSENNTGDRWRKYCFVTLLWIPLLLIAVTRDPAFPLPRSVSDLFFFPSEFKHFFSNHFPLRDYMARLHSRALLALNGPSEIGRVVVGKEGWLFLRMEGDKSVITAPYQDLIALRTQYEQRAALCRELGLGYRVLIVPSKQNIYSEYLPERFKKFAIRTSTTSLLGRFLKTKSTEIPTVDLLGPFLAEKKNCDLFFKTDTHWNEFGGFIGSEELRRSFTSPQESFSLLKYSIERWNVEGGNEAKILGIKDGIVEDYPTVIVHDGRHPTMANGQPLVMDALKLDTFTLPITRTVCPEAKMESVIVFHNSFGIAILPFISRQFKKSTFVWRQFIPELVRKERPEYVIDVHTSY